MGTKYTLKAREARRAMADVTGQLEALEDMTGGQLAKRYRDVFGEPTRSRNKAWLKKRVAWQLQANAEGGLSQRALDRIEQLAPLAPARWREPVQRTQVEAAPEPKPETSPDRDPRLPEVGTVITRTYKGTEHHVTVLDRGFEYDGRTYRSLSKIAREITGTAWNGFLFFKLDNRRAGGAS